jgi:hypothetical protein
MMPPSLWIDMAADINPVTLGLPQHYKQTNGNT